MALPKRPSIDEISTTAEPGPATRNGSSSALEMMAAALTLVFRVVSHKASSMKSTGIGPDTPAAWTNPPSEPSAVAAFGTSASMAAESVTSTTDHVTMAPWRSRQRVAVSSAPSALASHTATGRPTSASASAVSRPMPDPPPVINTAVVGDPRRSARFVEGFFVRAARGVPRLVADARLAGTASLDGDLAALVPRFAGAVVAASTSASLSLAARVAGGVIDAACQNRGIRCEDVIGAAGPDRDRPAAGWRGPVPTAPDRSVPSRPRWRDRPTPHLVHRQRCSTRRPDNRGAGRAMTGIPGAPPAGGTGR